MKSTKILVLTIAISMTASGLLAQSGHGSGGMGSGGMGSSRMGHGGGTSSGGTGSGGNGSGGMGSGGMGSGDMGMGMDGMGGMTLLTAPDGTLITTSVSLDSAANTYTTNVIALNASGAVAWRWAAPNGVHRMELAANLVLVSTGRMDLDASPNPASFELTALTLSTGAAAWKVTLPGVVMAMEPTTSGTYALVMEPGSFGQGDGSGMGSGHHGSSPGTGNGAGMMDGARKLVAISNSGVVLWSVPLSQ